MASVLDRGSYAEWYGVYRDNDYHVVHESSLTDSDDVRTGPDVWIVIDTWVRNCRYLLSRPI